mmetsp:Transcript_3161/g.5972  ORF Transcript_3161/g.5972 Transcript_3161/m.5972 type:complete len:228 (+) Transcript_3161:254-937(+)
MRNSHNELCRALAVSRRVINATTACLLAQSRTPHLAQVHDLGAIHDSRVLTDRHVWWQSRDLSPRGTRAGSCNLAFNVALVVSTADAEVPVLSPVWIPRVCNFPILDPSFDTPTDHPDSVSANRLSSDMVVDATAIILEVRVDVECSLHWATRHDGLHDTCFTCCGNCATTEGILVIRKAGVRLISCRITFGGAFGGCLLGATRRALCWVWIFSLRPMMVAMWQRKV